MALINATPGYIPKENIYSNKNVYINVHSSIFKNTKYSILRIIIQRKDSKKRKQLKCPSMDEWMNNMWYIHTMEYYSAFKRKEILSYATTEMNLEAICQVK